MFKVIQPPADEKILAETGKRIISAALDLGMTPDTQGFLMAWINGTRVVIEEDGTGKIVGLALLALGKRWVQNDFTATILGIKGENFDGMLDFIKQICAVMGVTSLFHQPDGAVEENGQLVHRVLELKLQ